MKILDHDGNGEVDFDEFLHLMTNTDVFIEVITSENKDEKERNDARRKGMQFFGNQNNKFEFSVILFDALTEFLKKQALKGANELINYYSKKYKKEFKHYGGHKGAHVVGHYADGARLVGLTENELYTQLKGLKQQSNLSDQELNSPYAKSFHLGLLKSIEEDRRRKPPVKPVGLGGPRRKKFRIPKSTSRGRLASIRENRVTLRVVGLERVKQFKSNERHSSTIRVSESVTTPDIMRQSRFSQIRERRQSLNQVIREESFDLPIPHRPGWSSQRINMVDVDIRISPGWSIVPLSDLSDLKEITKFAQNEYFTNVACEKLASNLKFYRSLNTRKPPSNHLCCRIKDCMVSYSAATTDNSVGRVEPDNLDEVFTADNERMTKNELRDRGKDNGRNTLLNCGFKTAGSFRETLARNSSGWSITRMTSEIDH